MWTPSKNTCCLKVHCQGISHTRVCPNSSKNAHHQYAILLCLSSNLETRQGPTEERDWVILSPCFTSQFGCWVHYILPPPLSMSDPHFCPMTGSSRLCECPCPLPKNHLHINIDTHPNITVRAIMGTVLYPGAGYRIVLLLLRTWKSSSHLSLTDMSQSLATPVSLSTVITKTVFLESAKEMNCRMSSNARGLEFL